MRVCATILAGGLAVGCGNGSGGNPGGDDGPDGPGPGNGSPDGGVGDALPLPDGAFGVSDGCPAMFAQDIVPSYHVEISAEEWAKLEDEFKNRPAREAQGLDVNPYHPVGFRYQNGEPVPGVLLRLKGQSSWLAAIALDANPKMQFVIAFNEVDPDARFMGVRKIELDMPRNDQSFIRQRLALYYLRSMGLEAQCANSARLYINGEYYGLYTGMERLDKEFLQRHYGDEDEGDLWEGGRVIKNNEETFTWARLNQFWAAMDPASIDAVVDVEGAVREWAAEAMLPDADGYYAGRPNFYLYDHPSRGFVWIAHDLDASFNYGPPDWSPIFSQRAVNARQHYRIIVGDPVWQEKYLDQLREMRAGYQVPELERLVDVWSAQIASAALEDPMKPFTMDQHKAAVASLRGAMAKRAAYLDGWLACRTNGGPDGDGDGFDMCHDCDDKDPAAHPGAAETCNKLDDDCDGIIDDLEGGATCPAP